MLLDPDCLYAQRTFKRIDLVPGDTLIWIEYVDSVANGTQHLLRSSGGADEKLGRVPHKGGIGHKDRWGRRTLKPIVAIVSDAPIGP